MKRKTFWLLIAAVVLCYFDGVMTYFGTSYGWSIEINPIIRMFHLSLGTGNWLLLHAIIGSTLGLILYSFKEKSRRIVVFWFWLETLIALNHLVGLAMHLGGRA
ncbi:hypothetical protein J7K86_02515 [bacterium]|nr:hypothetical protein [bacterium]